MKFFRKIRAGVDVAPLLEEVDSQEEQWLRNTGRQDKIVVQRDTNTIFVRGPVKRPDITVKENQESRFTEMSVLFPKAIAFMKNFAEEMDASLSRATIVRLKPQSSVLRHTDSGSYYVLRDRYHLILRSPAGSLMNCGDEQVRMQTGELWWFNNKEYHDALNESNEWRIHYIFDLLPREFARLAVNPMLPVDPK